MLRKSYCRCRTNCRRVVIPHRGGRRLSDGSFVVVNIFVVDKKKGEGLHNEKYPNSIRNIYTCKCAVTVKRFSVEWIRKGCVFLSVTLAHTHKTHNVLTIQYALHIIYYYTTTDIIYFVYEHDGQTNVKTVEISTGNAQDNNAYIYV